jgi:ribonuclease T2
MSCGVFFFLGLAVCSCFDVAAGLSKFCSPGMGCWPTVAEVRDLESLLNLSGSGPRIFFWAGGASPRVCAVPVNSLNEQPLYGAGVSGMQAVYSDLAPSNETCFDDARYHPEMCLMSVRNNPLEGWKPGVVVWPLNTAHVQLAVRFARAHNMCIMVAGTGHDFLNRHSCPFGLFIRTSLLKQMTMLPPAPEAPNGAFQFGSGIVFSEAHYFAAQNSRVISSGWASTVGMIGWSLGGGHGPFAPSYGLGVDNILSLTLVDATGAVLVANATSNRDLWIAARGGGGSVWGVVLDITVRAHLIPAAGFTVTRVGWTGLLCAGTTQVLDAFLDTYKTFTMGLRSDFSGLTFIRTAQLQSPVDNCSFGWESIMQYAFLGNATDPSYLEQTAPLQAFSAAHPPSFYNLSSIPNWYDFVVTDLEPITPVPWLEPGKEFVGGIASVLMNATTFASSGLDALKAVISQCPNEGRCIEQQLYQDITGNIGSPQDANVSISPGLRSGLIHWVGAGPYSQDDMASFFYPLGQHSYFSESAYNMPDWTERLWGSDVYSRLQAVKKKYDPHGALWCRHCVNGN